MAREFFDDYGEDRGKYAAEIRDFSSSVNQSGNTVLIWHVYGPPEKTGENYEPGELEGVYVGAGIESPKDTQFNAGTLVGRGPRSFALQPISVQFETGLSVATGVNVLALTYIGPLSI